MLDNTTDANSYNSFYTGMEIIHSDLIKEASVTEKYVEYFKKHYIVDLLPYE